MKMSVWGGCALAALAAGVGLSGSAGAAPFIEASSYTAPAAAATPVKFEVFLPLRNAGALETLLQRQQDKASPDYHRWLTPAQFKTRFGPAPDSMARVIASLKSQGFTVTAEHTRSVEVTGTTGTVAHAFAASLLRVQPKTGAARLVARMPLVLPAALKAEGVVVLAFDGRPLYRTFSSIKPVRAPDNRYSAEGPYWFDDLKQAYTYPSYQLQVNGRTLDGTGVKVAVLISNDVLDSDVTAYFENEKFAAKSGKKADPAIIHDYVNGGGVFDPEASGEATLDVEQVLGGAPGSTVGLVSVPDLSDGSISAGLIHIVGGNYYDMVNMSFGACELLYSSPAYNGPANTGSSVLAIYHSLFQQGNAQGITFVAASGDQGGLACPDPTYYSGSTTAKPKWVVGVSSPAVDPNVTAVGGGNLLTSVAKNKLNSTYVSENGTGDPEVPYDPSGAGVKVSGGYWGAGGGVSTYFTSPTYQTNLGVSTGSKMRTVPDVGMHVGGCPGQAQQPCNASDSSDVEVLNGALSGVIGTSAASPEFVSVLALFEQLNGRQGNFNPFLYASNAAQTAKSGPVVFHHPAVGFDGQYSAKQPNATYSYIFGNGTPIVRSLLGLSSYPAAGVPQTASNP